jgi:hypothetical protein
MDQGGHSNMVRLSPLIDALEAIEAHSLANISPSGVGKLVH